jgi:hypothetical protein
MHLLIPYAACATPACRAALPSLRLPNLSYLLTRLSQVHADPDPPDTLAPMAMPHERALARVLGLPGDTAAHCGHTPWAAYDLHELHQLHHLHQTAAGQAATAAPATAWAWLTPCHWQVGMDSVVMPDPAALALTEAESRALLTAMAPYFAEDGITLHWAAPDRWLASGTALHELACASVDRVIGQNVLPWLPVGAQAKLLRRLQSEMQMLLYTHPVNDARSERRQWTVNAFWISGAGALPPTHANAAPAATPCATPATPPLMPTTLRAPALQGDAVSWAAAWAQIDASDCAALRAELERGQPVNLTLCSERNALTFAPRPRSLWQRLGTLGRTPAIATLLESL